jgi:hypothetical protein
MTKFRIFFTPRIALLLLASFDPHHNTTESSHVSLLISVDAVLARLLDVTPGLIKPQTLKLNES